MCFDGGGGEREMMDTHWAVGGGGGEGEREMMEDREEEGRGRREW